MNEYKNWKILQIIPAQGGWKAIHCRESGNKEIEISNRSIICWALVEAVGETAGVQTQVRGIVQQSNDLAVVEDLIRTDKVWKTARIETNICLDTMIQTHIKNLIIGSSKPTIGLEQKNKKD